jgi:hypothetical protein
MLQDYFTPRALKYSLPRGHIFSKPYTKHKITVWQNVEPFNIIPGETQSSHRA